MFRGAVRGDLPQILKIYAHARAVMKASGNPCLLYTSMFFCPALPQVDTAAGACAKALPPFCAYMVAALSLIHIYPVDPVDPVGPVDPVLPGVIIGGAVILGAY